MSQYYGDIQLGDTVQWLFTTVDGSGVPTILTGSPTATAYTDGGVTQSATGVTLTANFDGVTGLNLMVVVASSGNGFAAGENIEIVLDAGTVDSNTVVGYAVGSFSVENRSNLRPTTVGNNEVDVTATGAVGIDWANVESQGTAVDLSGTDIQLVDTATTVTGGATSAAQTTAQNDLDTITGTAGALIDDGTGAGQIALTAGAIDNVTLVATTTVSTDAEADIAALNDVAATDIVSAGAITTLAGAVVNVDLVDTTTVSTDAEADIAALNDVAATDIVSAGAITTLSGAIVNVDLVDVSTAVTNDVGITQAAADKVWGTTVRVVSAATNITSTGTTTFTQTGDSFVRLGAPAGASVSADILEVEAQTRKIKKNEAFSDLTFLMVDSTTKDPKTGLTITEEVSKDGGSFAAATGTAAEIANGIYQMDASMADMNADILIFRFSSTGADDTFVTIVTKP